MKPRTYIEYVLDEPYKGLGAIRAKIGPTSDVDKIFSKMYSQYVLFRNKYSYLICVSNSSQRIVYHVKQTAENRRPSKMGEVVTLLFVHFNFIIQFRNMLLFLKSSTLHIMSNLCCVYWVLLCFVFVFLMICIRIVMSQLHPFSTVSCFRRFVSRDKISHYFDRLICQRLYYDAEIAWALIAPSPLK
jgi:hypothetical protein